LPIIYFLFLIFLVKPNFDETKLIQTDNYIEVNKFITQRFVNLKNGQLLNVNEGGDKNGQLLLFIHGFPE
jgi:hypothetical protein